MYQYFWHTLNVTKCPAPLCHGSQHVEWMCVRDFRLGGSVVRGFTWWVLPLDGGVGLSLVVASERLTGRVGGF
jgi:hypothetical protein